MIVIILVALRLIQVYSYLLLVYALMSWFPGAYDSKLGRIITGLVNPVLKPFRSIPMVFMGLDFTVFVVMGLLNLLSNFLISLF